MGRHPGTDGEREKIILTTLPAVMKRSRLFIPLIIIITIIDFVAVAAVVASSFFIAVVYASFSDDVSHYSHDLQVSI